MTLKSEDDVLIHLHVPKCAGSSVNAVLFNRFKKRSVPSGNVQLVTRFHSMTNEERDRDFDCMAGHYQWGLHTKFNREVKYISVVRHPLDRICSYFNYIHLREEHPNHELFGNLLDINDLQLGWLKSQPNIMTNFCNHLCFAYAGMRIRAVHYDKFEQRVILDIKNGNFIVGSLDDIEKWLRSNGILDKMASIPHENRSANLKSSREFVRASPEMLIPRVRSLLLRLNYFDTKIIEAIHWTNYFFGKGARPEPVLQAQTMHPLLAE
ncbi:sulfotransferase family 2 domain-containing protein (plasmid) [Acuticoccus sp. MNP-M23]|uniref:sulfotransferase family 2 domain-containing protein n=1 Tax=Acuticoccus sp. MNP-M23 TaxID=3072793 RepID=UPI002814CE45|nr:sulfotransferase family 2 domain-containing protein [Acuticoccus sp. MNP-M23]WMS45323.1 sulfotransferase family 2 domain-containing protein [Acuticoccus sp. MNP-M23]